jgi:cell division protein FtsA
MVGQKSAGGTLTILAEEVEDSASCIQRGCVYNVQDTAYRIRSLIRKLQNQIDSNYQIDKVYIGIGGQSLHSIEHIEVKTLNNNAMASEEDITALDVQCKAYRPENHDVLGISSPVYYVDGKMETNPVGVPCKRIEARYQLIVGQHSIRQNIVKCFEYVSKGTEIDLAGIIVSPLSLADAMLGKDDKDLGCALVDFGAGVTSVTVYKRNKLIYLSVIPLGGNLITKDLTNLPIVESDAERLKITYGSAIMQKDKESAVLLEGKEKIGIREINTVVEARSKEIVENVYAQVKLSKEIDSLGAGILLAGGASAMQNLQELIQERFKKDVRFSTIRREWMENEDDRMGNPLYMTAISLLIAGTENCIQYIPPKITETKPVIEEEAPIDDTIDEPKRGGFWGRIFSFVDEVGKQT